MTVTIYLVCRFCFAHFSSHCLVDHWKVRIPFVLFFCLCFQPAAGRQWTGTGIGISSWSTAVHGELWFINGRLLSENDLHANLDWHLIISQAHILCSTPVTNSPSSISNGYSPVSMNQKLLWHHASLGRNAAPTLCQSLPCTVVPSLWILLLKYAMVLWIYVSQVEWVKLAMWFCKMSLCLK